MEVAGHRVPEVIEYTLEETQEFLHAKFYRNLTGSEAMSKVVKNDSFSSRSRRPDGGSFALILEALSTTCLSSTHDDLAQRLLYTFAADQRDECPEVLVGSATALRATQRVAVTLNELKGFRNSGCRAIHAAVAPHRFCAPALTEPVGLPHGKAGRLFFCPAVRIATTEGCDRSNDRPISPTVGIRDIPPDHANLV